MYYPTGSGAILIVGVLPGDHRLYPRDGRRSSLRDQRRWSQGDDLHLRGMKRATPHGVQRAAHTLLTAAASSKCRQATRFLVVNITDGGQDVTTLRRHALQIETRGGEVTAYAAYEVRAGTPNKIAGRGSSGPVLVSEPG